MQVSEEDRFREFLNEARKGNYGGYPRLEELVNPLSNNQAISNSIKRLRILAKKIIRSTGLAHPHLLQAQRLEDHRINYRSANPSLFNMTSDIRMIGIFLCLLPLIALAATSFLFQSFQIALLVMAIGLLLATYRITDVPKTVRIMRFSLELDWLIGSYALLAPLSGLFITGVDGKQVWLLLLCSIVSLFTVCFSGKNILQGVSLVSFLLRDSWIGVRIDWENLAFWLPRRVYRVETSLQEYINLANESGLLVGPFSVSTRDVLRQWFGYDPFVDGSNANGNFPPEPPPTPASQNENTPQSPPTPAGDPWKDDRQNAEAEANYYEDLRLQRERDDEDRVS